MSKLDGKYKLSLLDWYYYWTYRSQEKLFGSDDPHGWSFHIINVEISAILLACFLVLKDYLFGETPGSALNYITVIVVIFLGYACTYVLIGGKGQRNEKISFIESQEHKRHFWLSFAVPILSICLFALILSLYFTWLR